MRYMGKSSISPDSVLITGCSSGIGRATAVALAKQGFTVFGTVRRESDAQNLKDLKLPGLIPVCPVDLSRPEDIAHAFVTVADELKRRNIEGLFALVNNAGAGKPSPIELMNLEELRTELNARLAGSVDMVRKFLPLLREARGRIIWITTPAIIPMPFVASIHACDFAVNCIARTLDIELKRWNIPNIMIRCGGIRTPAGLRTAQDIEKLLRTGPPDRVQLYESELRRWGEDMAEFDRKRTDPDKVARLVLKALSAGRPRRRYSVGHMSKAAAFLELLPQSVTDRILKKRF